MEASVWWEPAKSSEIQGTCGSWNAILSEKDKFAAVQENWGKRTWPLLGMLESALIETKLCERHTVENSIECFCNS